MNFKLQIEVIAMFLVFFGNCMNILLYYQSKYYISSQLII